MEKSVNLFVLLTFFLPYSILFNLALKKKKMLTQYDRKGRKNERMRNIIYGESESRKKKKKNGE